MKIGIITTSFPRWKQDYIGSFVYEAALAIQRQGFEIKVITIHSPGTLKHETWEGIDIYRTKYLPESWELLKSEGGGLPEVWKHNRKARIQIIPFMIAFMFDVLIHTRDCDLLHANWTLSGAMAYMNYLLFKIPYLVTIQGSDIYKAVKLPFVTTITRIALTKAKKVLVLSQALATQVNLIGVPFSNIKIIPNGVDTNRFTPLPYEKRENIILFVGSLIERKGIKYLIKAFTTVTHLFPEMKLIIIGEGVLRIECEGLVQSLGIIENVKFVGAQSQEQVAESMRKAKIFVLPSIEEGLGVVLLEALSSGTPIVASDVGGISDVVTDRVGILVPPGDIGQLEEAILSMLNLEPNKWYEFHNNARIMATEIYDWGQIAQKIVELY